MTRPAGIPELLSKALAGDATRPLLTYYDDGTGERTELSVATFANWVAKTANLLQDSLGTQPGDRIAVRLPAHWQSAVWLTACWALGAVAAPVPSGAQLSRPAQVAVVAADDADPPAADELVALGLGPLGLPRPGGLPTAGPAGALDYDREVHGHGDRFIAPRLARSHDVALELAAPTLALTGTDLLRRAGEAAGAWRLGPGDRVLCAAPLDTLDAILATLLIPLATGAAAVLCRSLDPARLPARVESERVVAVLSLPGLSPLSLPELRRLSPV